ncbi:MAG: alpha/beta hydrolase, partial [Verrucomicrobiota bacterium]
KIYRFSALLAILPLLQSWAAEPTQSNVIYGMDHGSALLMDVYLPANPNGAGVIFIMGTGFTAYGEYDDVPLKELDLWLLENGIFKDFYGESEQGFVPLLESGFAVFSINHRLGPKNHYPAQIADCQRAVQFVRFHAAKYGIESHWIASMGHSSGASMATFLGLSDETANPEASDPVSRQSSRVQAVIAAAGVHDLLEARKSAPGSSAMLQSLTGRAITYQPPGHPVFETYRQASTVTRASSDDPPFFLIHGDADPAVDLSQSQLLKTALDKAGVESELLIAPGANHAELGEPVDPLPFDQAAAWLLDKYRQP